MLNKCMGKLSLIAVACAWLSSTAALADAPANLDVPAGALVVALEALADQADLNLVYQPAQLRDIKTQGLKGNYSGREAVELLIKGTTLRVYTTEQGAMVIAPPLAGKDVARRLEEEWMRVAQGGSLDSRENSVARARADSASEALQTTAASPEDENKTPARNKSVNLDEIVVTAQKRKERLQDVPAAVSSIGGDRLEALHVNSLADLVDYVPGAAIVNNGPGFAQIVLRGINTSYNNNTTGATVATYIDELPAGPSNGAARGGQWGFDLSPYDIERVEVLKGPQGTLYGANTLGGIVKYATRRPNMREFEARTGGSTESIDGGGFGWVARAGISMPVVVDKLAVRLSGFYKHNDGYIDNVGTDVEDSNRVKQYGGLLSTQWQPTERLSLRGTVLMQDTVVSDLTNVTVNGALHPIYGAQSKRSNFPEPYWVKARNYSVTADWDIGFATLTGASGWSKLNWDIKTDLSAGFGPFTPGNPDALTLFSLGADFSKVVQEVRLASSATGRIQWLLGGYYTKEKSGAYQDMPAFTPEHIPLGEDYNLFWTGRHQGYDAEKYPDSYQEKAGFANLTFKITDRFDVGGGGRYSSYSTSSSPRYVGGFFWGVPGGATLMPGDSASSVGVWVWMANARYHLNQDMMIYTRYATGYRPGSGCDFRSDGTPCGVPLLGVPGLVKPDETTNYEAGLKGQFFDRRLQLDLSVFYIDWLDVQVPTVTEDGFGYAGNGARASSTGFELAMAYQLFAGLQLGATLAYTDARLSEDAPGLGARDGEQLPGSPRLAGSFVADYQRALSDRVSVLTGASYRYRGEVPYLLESATPSVRVGAQSLVDLYAGVAVNNVTLKLYGTNVLNERAFNGLSYIDDASTLKLVPVQARTIGLSADFSW